MSTANVKANIAEKFAKISQCYKPAIAAELNGQYVKLVKFDSPFGFSVCSARNLAFDVAFKDRSL